MIIMILITLMPVNTVLAEKGGNVGGTDAGGNTGNGSNEWKFTQRGAGVRLSIYWAESEEAFNESDKVQKIGDTINLIPDGIPSDFKPEYYTNKTVFDYMNGDESKNKFATYKINKDHPFKIYTKDESVVAKMPSPTSGESDAWLGYFMGIPYKNGLPVDKNVEPSFLNIPAISKLCGYEISSEDFADGNYTVKGEIFSNGWYKIFIEPELPCIINGTYTYVTLRDMIKLGESGNENTSTSKLVGNLNLIYEYLANPLFLIEQEDAALNMNANNWDKVTGKYLDPQKEKGNSYKVHYDESTKTSDKAEIIKQLGINGKIRKSMGCGVINPQRLKGETVKVVTSYVQYKPQADGTYTLEECLPTETKQMAKSTVKKLLENDKVKIGVSGTGYLNDVFTSSVNLTKNSSSEEIVWEKGLPINQETDKDITAKYVKSLNLGLKTRATFFAKNGILISKAASDDYLDTFTDLQSALKEISGTSVDTELKDLKSEHFNCFTESSDILDFNTSNANYSSIYKKTAIAKAFYEDMGISGDIDYMIEHATYIKDIDDIKLGSSKAYTVYIRYIVTNPHIQKSKVKIYKDGKYESTITLPDVAVKCYQDMDAEGNLIYYLPALKTAGTIDKDYKEAALVKWGTSTATMLEDMPSNPIHEGTTLTPKVNLVMGENVYVMFRLDIETPKDKTLEIPEWRLSKYDTDMDYLNNAFMSLDLRADAGHLAYASAISPSGTYNYDTVNPNGKISTASNTPANMKYTDYLHTKAKSTGSYNVSHNNSNVAVKVAGTLNGIKSSDMSGLKLASWATSGSDKSKLAEYDLTTGTSSKLKSSADIKKTETLSYGIKNKNSYTHYYSIDNDYYVPGSDGGTPKDPSDDTSGYWVCGCYLSTETPGVSYTTADYKVGITYHLYKAVSTDTLKVKATKTEENGKTTITQQNEDTLNIYPEVPMLFEDDNGKESIQFVAGTQSRKIPLVDYHTLEYTAYVDAKVTPPSTVTDSKAKQTANKIGLCNLPVVLKGETISASFSVKNSKNSKEQGTLTVKSYALDIADNNLKTTWGNEDYNSKAAHTKLLDAFNNFSSGTASEQLNIAVPNGTNSAYEGPKVSNKLSYKLKDTDSTKHTLIVRGGVLTEVDGKSLASIKADDKDLYAALVGMKLVGNKEDTVLKTLVSGEGDKLTESSFATLANKERGLSDIRNGAGWYFEDTTILEVVEYKTTYTLPISGFSDKVPMSIGKYLKTPIDKNKFFSEMSKGYNILNYTMTSKSITGLGTVKVYFEHNGRIGSDFGPREATYGVGNVSVTDSTFGGF